MIPVILCGGTGTRLWPLSRESYPKQFLPLQDGQSLFQSTVQRLDGLGAAAPMVVSNAEHRFLVAEQLRRLGVAPTALVLEPCGRNTAPAVAAAARLALAEQPDALLLVLPADHMVVDTPAFRAAVEAGRAAAEDGRLVTFGVTPTAAETGYGYIEVDGPGAAEPPWLVRRFVEKPDRARAESYLASGRHLWNSGMFLFRADRYLEELARHAPAIAAACEGAVAGARHDLDFLRLDEKAFTDCPADSVDYAVMEHTDRAVAVPLDAGWSDVGSWSALRGMRTQDADGNAVHGDVWLEDSHDCYVHAEERMVAAVGLRDHIVVETADAVLVAPCDRAQDVKVMVARLKAAGRTETFSHRRVFRPWGSYEGISRADRFQVKRIIVEPGARLSLQMHHHRAEHWVVVRGTARVTCGDKELLLSEDQSSYIPIGVVHRLENPGVIPLELIEVQTGSYLGEDDIVRLEDRYGRERVG